MGTSAKNTIPTPMLGARGWRLPHLMSGKHTSQWRLLLARLLASSAGGLALFLSFQPRPFWWLAPIGLAVLWWVLRGVRARSACGYGFVAGLSMMLPLLWWTGEYVGLIAAVPLAVVQGSLVALSAVGIALVSRLRGAVVWGALMWVAGEALRSAVPFGGFPWADLAYSQLEGPVVWLAALGGTPLVGFAVALVGFAGGELLVGWAWRSSPRSPRVAALWAPVVVTAVAGIGAWAPTTAPSNVPSVRIAVVQGNVPRPGLDFNAERRAVLDNHVRQSLALARDIRSGLVPKPDVVIWPENASDIDPYANRDAFAAINKAVQAVGVPVAVGAVVGGDSSGPRNTMILWDPVRGPVDEYTKRRLQPFGETMPMRSFFRLFTEKVDRAGRMVPGEDPTVFAIGQLRLGVAMCYEVIFDDVVRESVLNGANLLAVPSNNATFGFSDMTYQQLAIDRFRAIEHGRSVVVATTSGVSAVIRPDGVVAAQTGLFEPGVLVESVPLRSSFTVADRLGAWPERGAVGLAWLSLGMAFTWKRRSKKQPGRRSTESLAITPLPPGDCGASGSAWSRTAGHDPADMESVSADPGGETQ